MTGVSAWWLGIIVEESERIGVLEFCFKISDDLRFPNVENCCLPAAFQG
jgi:hypothetical protein